MKKEWNPFLLDIIYYREQDIVVTSMFDDGNDSTSSSKDEFEGEIDWG